MPQAVLASDGCRIFHLGCGIMRLVPFGFHSCSVLVHKDGRLPMEFAALWSHPTLLGIAQQLLVRMFGTLHAS